MRYLSYIPIDLVNGPGTRCTVFLSGCAHRCKGCYNAVSWNPKNGVEWTPEIEDRVIADLKSTDIPLQGISITGGDPLLPLNHTVLLAFMRRIKKEAPGKDIWLWTGYTIEALSDQQRAIVDLVDVVIDGRFEQDLKDPALLWRGSSNQRIIEVKDIM